MNKLNAKQIELFENRFNENKTKNKFSFKSHGKPEKIIAVIISYIIIGIVCFSFGIERGKNFIITKLKNSSNFIKVSAEAKPIPVKKTVINKEPIEKIETNKKKSVTESAIEKSIPSFKEIPGNANYTIQLATFTSTDYAQTEAKRLLKKGFNAFTLNTGKHVVVCWGKFTSKNTAKSSSQLKALKEIYEDCFVRKL
ncbi:MAG: SPOR domain-containing protein [Candidatus Gygaella obscura]|nr:SPOR domain-containing protein [Candidatus Gygaella obscura]